MYFRRVIDLVRIFNQLFGKRISIPQGLEGLGKRSCRPPSLKKKDFKTPF